ncbi:hypothetical protein [Nocardia asteroides]|uniref:Uncharacterized protein n=1 Tax=Nocardia asteroides NBRC 15531 TaxID=1110697 RepID=U5E561_NOCAS|nr:hypothetical protein [Nocardia asteroides]TLF69370.1 hypothetical protein FEK33_03470 [Nocardia asteroides NBRC 15531]UGT48864.1 hypothetical protein LT345_31315 [Nocardia asteroides]SFL73211.1 hypothetical protein SAMN05444423_101704 [Nocardia asteroides]VEG31370.1 Uncharacterised protein [Nocardia asteroides]GAD82115.1 hypothetical protein NCAST_06_00330 [Nocardia asteroides NBRC 15531]
MAEPNPYGQLLGQAQAGEVYLNDDAAAYHMFKACDQRLTDLRDILDLARRTQNVSGFGDFQMAKDLETKFRAQAQGEPNSLYEVVLADIEAVQQLQEVFKISFKHLTGTDIENANALDYAAGQV